MLFSENQSLELKTFRHQEQLGYLHDIGHTNKALYETSLRVTVTAPMMGSEEENVDIEKMSDRAVVPSSQPRKRRRC